MARGKFKRRRSWWKVAIVGLLNPRPRWWAGTSVWLVFGAALFLLTTTPIRGNTAGGVVEFDVVEATGGELHWPGVFAAGDITWQVELNYMDEQGAGYGVFAISGPGIGTHPSQGLPVRLASPSESARIMAWLVMNGASDPDLALQRDAYSKEMPLRILRLCGQGRQLEVWHAWWWWPRVVALWLGIAIIVSGVVIWFVRGSQDAWFRLQLKRLGAGKCPSCAYELKGLPSGQCPECGADIAAARREAERMAGRSREKA